MIFPRLVCRGATLLLEQVRGAHAAATPRQVLSEALREEMQRDPRAFEELIKLYEDLELPDQARRRAEAYVERHPERDAPHLFLGRLYKAAEREKIAEKMFARAVQLDPDCVEAIRELRLLNMRRERSKGLVRRILRR